MLFNQVLYPSAAESSVPFAASLRWQHLSSSVAGHPSEEALLQRSNPDVLEAELAALLIRLDFSEAAFPTEPYGSYLNVSLGEYRFRLYALMWEEQILIHEDAEEAFVENQLYLILQPIAGSYLTMGTELHVREGHLPTSSQQLRCTSQPAYLYVQVFGEWAARFSVVVHLPNGQVLELPPLSLAAPECDRASNIGRFTRSAYPALFEPSTVTKDPLL
ncbi:MAG: hypothetical protein AAFS04_09010 [Cyanobacteria bacterium J06631_9]